MHRYDLLVPTAKVHVACYREAVLRQQIILHFNSLMAMEVNVYVSQRIVHLPNVAAASAALDVRKVATVTPSVT